MINPLSILISFITAFLLTAGTAAAAAPKQTPLTALSGFWYTEGHEGGIELYPCDDKICGRFHWMKNEQGGEGEDGVSRDMHNPDPNQRRRPLCHMQFMGNFTPDGKTHYSDGWIYNPHDGGIYSAAMTQIDRNNLKLRGYLFFEFLGQSQIWTRAKSMPDCNAGD